jgi:hypothetical protein
VTTKAFLVFERLDYISEMPRGMKMRKVPYSSSFDVDIARVLKTLFLFISADF